MKRITLTSLLAAAILAGGPALAAADAPARAPVAGAHHRDGAVRGWQLLATETVTTRSGREVIEIGRHEGRFDEIMIVVDGQPIELRNVTIAYGNGRERLAARSLRFDRRSARATLELAGAGGRAIDSVSFQVRSSQRTRFTNLRARLGAARIEIYGRSARDVDDRGRDRRPDRRRR